jgi:hypothetical protein
LSLQQQQQQQQQQSMTREQIAQEQQPLQILNIEQQHAARRCCTDPPPQQLIARQATQSFCCWMIHIATTMPWLMLASSTPVEEGDVLLHDGVVLPRQVRRAAIGSLNRHSLVGTRHACSISGA